MVAQGALSVVSHWSTLIENFQASPLVFYQAVEGALARRQVPETKNSRLDYREGGLLSANREYLHIEREKLVFDICGAPFGTGFFVSWWLAEEEPYMNPVLRVVGGFGLLAIAGFMLFQFGMIIGLILLAIGLFGGLAAVSVASTESGFDDGIVRALPLVGTLYTRLFKPTTYYRIDTMHMFQTAVHNAVLEVIDTMTEGKGIRVLSESDRKPIMWEFYAKER